MTGIRVRHARGCGGDPCKCRKSYEAFVFVAREGRKVRSTHKTLAAAKAWRADAMAANNRGKLRTPSPMTVAQAAEEFLAGAKVGTIPSRGGGRYRPATLRGHERSLRLRVLPAIGHMKLGEVRRADLQDLADRMAAEGYTPGTIQNTINAARVLFGRAVQRDLIASDPTERLELRSPDGRRERVAGPEEAAALLAALPDHERALWATAVYGGLRRGELRALRWDDVDLSGRMIRVRRSWDDREGPLDGGKSKAARRDVPVLAPLAPVLAAHKLRTGRDGADLIFGRTAAEPFQPSTVGRRAAAAWEGAGLQPLTLHEARHSCASLLIAAGCNLKALSTVMGHANISITLDRYGHLLPGSLDEVAQRADAYLAMAVKT